jgi:Mn2+/Fe2+ NRAMP family transporter
LVVAATGVGAGDLVAAAKAGATYGLPLLWTALLGAALKLALAEGIARWQLATGSTLLEGWGQRLGFALRFAFLLYLLLWTFVLSAALMSACGLAAHALLPSVSLEVWAVAHALVALGVVWFGGYGGFETVMKVIVAVMVVTLLGSTIVQRPPAFDVLRGLALPIRPAGSTVLALGVIGGVGGTLTLLSYNYWMREKGWSGAAWAPAVRVDLAVGYGLTGVFGVAVILLGGAVLLPQGIEITGREGVLRMAVLLGESFGRAGEIVFLLGFWGAVASSLLGVWQGVPYLFEDCIAMLRRRTATPPREPGRRSRAYRGYLLFMTFPPMLLLLLGRPVWLVVIYAALGSLFMPFLAATLLFLNNDRRTMGALRNGWVANTFLVLCLGLFVYLMGIELRDQLQR